MSRSAKIAGVALAAGILMATAIAITMQNRTPKAEPAVPVATSTVDRLSAELARCRTLTMPDAGCDAAWEEHRRRFLGRDRRAPFEAPSSQGEGKAAAAPSTMLSAPTPHQGE